MLRRIIAGAAVAAMAVGAASCGSGDSGGGKTLNVPADFATIQEAVNAAEPGDLVLIAEGTYNEAVDVTTDEIVIRGIDRNKVILDGKFELTNGIKVVGADGVAIENMTGRNYTSNSFYWTGADGYRASYLTSYRTGDYGIYAFDSVNGQIEHSYASGSRDAGVYIGQCYPCNAVIDDVISEWNGLGYSGTNSGGNLLIVNSTWRYNRAGIVPNTGSYELCYPERETTIVGNIVHGNQNADTPAIDVALLAMGNGILVAGGVGNVIERNLVFDHERTGIGLVPFPEDGPSDVPNDDPALLTTPCEDAPAPSVAASDLPASALWSAKNNRVIGNKVSDSGIADISVGDLGSDVAGLGNCFRDNEFTVSAPLKVEELAPCDGTINKMGDWAAGALDLVKLIASARPPEKDWKTTPEPTAQPNMPDAATAKAEPATSMPRKVDLAAITIPAKP